MEKNSVRKILHRLDLERRQLMRPRFLELGLTVGEGQPRILNCLLEQGEMSQRELAGLIERRVNPSSRRAHLIHLTLEGKEKAAQVQKQFAWLDQVLWGELEEEEMENLYKTLEKIEKNVKNML